MKKRLLLTCTLALVFSGMLKAQQYAPVALTGFTADVIANGSGTVAATTSTDADGASFALVALNYVNPSSISPTSGLPNNGLITSQTTAGLTFQLASYSASNSLRIAGTGSGTLALVNPEPADQVVVLATSGSGTSAVTITVNFTDATSQTFTQTVNDWYNGAGFAIQGISRVSRATNAIENSATNPRLYQYLLNLSAANAGKTVQSVMFNKTSTGGVLNVLGVTVRTVPSALPVDAGVTSILSPASGCGLTTQETISVIVKNFGTTPQSNITVSYRINNGLWTSQPISGGPLAANTSVNFSFSNKEDLSALGTYTIEAKTNLIGDQLATNDTQTKTIVLSAPAATPTLTANGPTTVCSGTPVMLTAASSPGATFTWYQNGNQITGANAASYITTSPGNYTAMASSGGCSSAVSAPVTLTVNFAPATPTLIASGPTAICSGGSVTFTALTSAQGASFIWFRNNNVIPGATSSTYTATTTGNYTAAVIANGCNSPAAPDKVVTATPQPAAPVISQTGFSLTSSSASGNQWYHNNTPIPNATGRTFTPNANGTYTVISTLNGCASAVSNAITITNTGLMETQARLMAEVYPNPSSGLFRVALPGGAVYELEVWDVTGKIVQRQQVKGTATQLDLTKATPGMYFLRITSASATAIRKLVVE